MQVKAFRGDIFRLEQNLAEFFEDSSIKIKNLQMFPVSEKYENDINEPFYEILILHE